MQSALIKILPRIGCLYTSWIRQTNDVPEKPTTTTRERLLGAIVEKLHVVFGNQQSRTTFLDV
jgi:hypothetical protein